MNQWNDLCGLLRHDVILSLRAIEALGVEVYITCHGAKNDSQ